MTLSNEISRAIKEIREVATAVSVVGTTHSKLRVLAGFGKSIAKDLFGTRYEVTTMQGDIMRRVHDVLVSKADASAYTELMALVSTLERTRQMVDRGIGVAPDRFKIYEVVVGNEYGYTEAEAEKILTTIRTLWRRLNGFGIYPGDMTIILDEEWFGSVKGTNSKWSQYDRGWETIVVSPLAAGGSLYGLGWSVGEWIWDKVSDNAAKGLIAESVFLSLFAQLMEGDDKVVPSEEQRPVARVLTAFGATNANRIVSY